MCKNNAYRKNAILEIERSSCGERDEAKIERSTAGVTGIRRLVSKSGGGGLNSLYMGRAVDEEVEVEEDIGIDYVSGVVHDTFSRVWTLCHS